MADIASNKSNIFCGLLAAAAGGFIIAGASGLFGFDLHPAKGVPVWIGIGAGGLFLAGGLAVILQSLALARPAPDGGLSAASPRWLQFVSLALALFIVGDFVAIFSWIAFGPGERHFSTSFGIGGIFVSNGGGETLGRVAFGIGAALGGAIFLAFLFDGVRRLRRRDQI